MSIARVRALRSVQTSFRPAARAVPRVSARTQLVAGRRYASGGGHGHDAPSSDLPWLLGAVAVTIPSCYFLWPSPHEDHGHHDDHHDEEHEEKEDGGEESGEDAGEEDSKDEGKDEGKDDSKDEGGDDKEDGSSEDDKDSAKPFGAEGESQPKGTDANKKSDGSEEAEPKDTPDSKGNTDGAQFKGKVKDESAGDTRKVESDSKGAYKKRIDSGLGKNLGAAGEESDEEDPTGNSASMAKKQGGMSNTATRHSTEPHKDSTKSKKPEGPETAKAIGTIDPNRKQV